MGQVLRTYAVRLHSLRFAALQGGWEDDETVDCAARRETVEEAGVRGVLQVSFSTT